MTSDYSVCALVPVYNHGSTAGEVVAEITARGLPVILVDDGSDEDTRAALIRIDERHESCTLVRLRENSGKGGAVMAGLAMAREEGFSHALQIDADGQHDLQEIPVFLEKSRERKGALIAGAPVYDESAPKSRLIGRKITNFWIAVETLSRDIPDAMCGFRVYPVDAALRALRRSVVNRRMGFDIEVLVRLHWRRVPLIFLPVKVEYPEGGTSNFRMVRDNLGITAVHTKLFFGMLLRSPVILASRLLRRFRA